MTFSSDGGEADLPDCHLCDLGLEEIALHAFYHCPQVHRFWDYVGELTARFTPDQLVSINLTYICDNVLFLFSRVKSMVFFTLLPVARMVV